MSGTNVGTEAKIIGVDFNSLKDKPYSVVPLGPKPQIVTCPHCAYYVTTEVNIIPSAKTHFKAMLMCICCLCFIPYICPICMNVDHFCPECENYIGTYIN